VRNLMITMLLGGLWHGAAWTFVAWGALHGIGLIAYRLWSRRQGSQRQGLTGRWRTNRALLTAGRMVGTAFTFYWVCCAWIFFRAQSFGDAFILLKGFVLFQASGEWVLEPTLFAWIAVLAVVHWLNSHRTLRRLGDWIDTRVPDPAFAAGYGIATALALAFVPLRTAPFIYFQF
jgi:D-alanyl-lipoteichoic acid acyltransferase DltB (MBOAT superfamily)